MDLVRARLVPELLVADLAASLHFWCGLCGFRVAYDRPEDRFAYLDREGAQVMLEEAAGPGRRWITGALEQPFGRGINLQIEVADIVAMLGELTAVNWPLYLPLEEKTYRAGTGAVVVRQFIVQDPDGYLLRFQQAVQAASPAAQPLDQAHWKL